jgi:hypothetical protein
MSTKSDSHSATRDEMKRMIKSADSLHLMRHMQKLRVLFPALIITSLAFYIAYKESANTWLGPIVLSWALVACANGVIGAMALGTWLMIRGSVQSSRSLRRVKKNV